VIADRTIELLYTLDEGLQEAAYELVLAARNAGIPMHIISGRRSYEVNRDVGGAEKSFHLSGRAFDVAISGYTRDQIPRWWWQEVGFFAEQNFGLFWGGRFNDVNHFDARRLVSV
jgi:hypothetical protein